MFKKRIAFFRSIQFLGDLALVAVAWLAAYFLRFYTPLVPVTKGVPYLTLYLSLLLLVLGVFAVVLPMGGLYRRPWAGLGSLWWPVARGTTVGVVVSVTLTYFIQPYEFSRLVFLWFWVLITAGLLAFRPLLRRYWGRHVSGGYGEEALVVGVGELGRMVAQKLLRQPVLGVRVVGFLTQRPELVGTKVDGLPVLGLYSEVTQILATQQVNLVIIALPLSAHDRINDLLNLMADELVDIKVVPDLFRHVSLAGSVEEFEGLPFIGLRGSPLEGWARVAKRLTDILGSALGLAALSPLLLLLTALVKLSSPGPVLYRQSRMGLDGRVFTMYKFRSMRIDAEKECGPVWARQDDPRRTRLGAFLRKTSLDELPQLINVLKGEMSLVGPRPERPEFIQDFRRKIPGYMLRHKMKAGITGWAQINGWRGNTSLEKRIEHDLFYIENWSLWLDCKIMFLTLFKGLVNPHAY